MSISRIKNGYLLLIGDDQYYYPTIMTLCAAIALRLEENES